MANVGGDQRAAVHRGYRVVVWRGSRTVIDGLARDRRREQLRERNPYRGEVEIGRVINDENGILRPRATRRTTRGDLAENECRLFRSADRDAANRDVSDTVAVEIGEPIVGRRRQE